MRVVDDHIDRLWKLREQATSFADIAAIEAAIAALSHAAGQDGEQCRAASGSDRDYTTDERAQIVNEFYLTMLDLRGAVTEEQECRLLRAGLLLRALSRGVPEGK